MNEGNLHINRFTIEALELTRDDNILEIGMGNGFFVKDILSADVSVRYTGCDFSPTMVKEAHLLNKVFVQAQQAEFLLADAGRLPFKSETFDKVFTVNTIYFWDDPGKTLSEIARVLKPEGWIVIAVRPERVMSNYPFAQFGFQLFTTDDLKTLLKENNFFLKDIIERKEPDQEVNGMKIPVETLIAIGSKL